MSAAPQASALKTESLVLLREKKRRIRESKIQIPVFRGPFLEAQSCSDHEFIQVGPADTGKTFWGLWHLDSILRGTPNARAVLVRKVHADMATSVLHTWKNIIEIRGGVSRYGGEKAEFYTYRNGSRCYIIGLDRPGKVLSSGFDAIYVNQAEELSIDDWEFLSTRVTGRDAVIEYPLLFGDCNPGPPWHWIRKRPSLRLFNSTHKHNPEIYDDEGNPTPKAAKRMADLEALTGVRKERFFLGNWAAVEGKVYEEFKPAVHVIEPEAVPEIRRWIVSIDFGYTNPFVAQLWGLDSDDRIYLVSEIYKTRTLVEDHAVAIKAMVGDRKIDARPADHDREDRATLERHGITTTPAYKDVSMGIQAVQARLVVQKDGKPRLFIVRGALVSRDEELVRARKPICTEQEFDEYAWPKSSSGKPVKEVPVKEHDHGMDACRYAVAELDLADGSEIQWRLFMGEAAKAKKKPAEAVA